MIGARPVLAGSGAKNQNCPGAWAGNQNCLEENFTGSAALLIIYFLEVMYLMNWNKCKNKIISDLKLFWHKNNIKIDIGLS